ncbi:hypothetical protein Clacol_005589 [Clathrus columnatus]|uniref:Oxo-4-hydroxy-4-carboxy-5-ureidoimidazoline decarboxylase domain-containing protein n=1 Tax=Clathrus columnatus TaxID=1419009 RepID=A0AAV5A9R3_9AGAM|nr:hypothetical protein Clacol_005589 [Clathrus columnatus]
MSVLLTDTDDALSTLFEPSSVLRNKLVPEINQFKSNSSLADSRTTYTYIDLIELAMSLISQWDIQSKAQFIAAHPRIGEVKNLSAHSQKEQASIETPNDVLVRLGELNAFYEARYPGLRYITFVNGRSRTQIKEELQARLAIDHSWPGERSIDDALCDVTPIQAGSAEWIVELERAITDVGLIAKHRARAIMGCI